MTYLYSEGRSSSTELFRSNLYFHFSRFAELRSVKRNLDELMSSGDFDSKMTVAGTIHENPILLASNHSFSLTCFDVS